MHCNSTIHTYIHLFNGLFSGTVRVSWYQKGKTDQDFTEARDREWQWHQLGILQVCISLQTDNHASTPPLCFLQAGCPSCCPTNSVKALKAGHYYQLIITIMHGAPEAQCYPPLDNSCRVNTEPASLLHKQPTLLTAKKQN